MLSIIHQCQMMMMMPFSPCLIQRLNLNLSLNHLSSGERELTPLWKVPAHQVPQLATRRMKAKLNTAKIKRNIKLHWLRKWMQQHQGEKIQSPHIPQKVVYLLMMMTLTPSRLQERSESSNCWRLKISSCHHLTEADAFTTSRVFTCSAFHPGLQTD